MALKTCPSMPEWEEPFVFDLCHPDPVQLPHFTDVETKVQRGKVTYSESPSTQGRARIQTQVSVLIPQSRLSLYSMLSSSDLCELKASNSNARLRTAKSWRARAPAAAGPVWVLILHNWVNSVNSLNPFLELLISKLKVRAPPLLGR